MCQDTHFGPEYKIQKYKSSLETMDIFSFHFKMMHYFELNYKIVKYHEFASSQRDATSRGEFCAQGNV